MGASGGLLGLGAVWGLVATVLKTNEGGST